MWIKGFGYQSEATQFINDLKVARPTLEAEQLAGRALLWDTAPIDLDQRARAKAADVPQKAYPYQTQV